VAATPHVHVHFTPHVAPAARLPPHARRACVPLRANPDSAGRFVSATEMAQRMPSVSHIPSSCAHRWCRACDADAHCVAISTGGSGTDAAAVALLVIRVRTLGGGVRALDALAACSNRAPPPAATSASHRWLPHTTACQQLRPLSREAHSTPLTSKTDGKQLCCRPGTAVKLLWPAVNPALAGENLAI
jgi:hypothetical protein